MEGIRINLVPWAFYFNFNDVKNIAGDFYFSFPLFHVGNCEFACVSNKPKHRN